MNDIQIPQQLITFIVWLTIVFGLWEIMLIFCKFEKHKRLIEIITSILLFIYLVVMVIVFILKLPIVE